MLVSPCARMKSKHVAECCCIRVHSSSSKEDGIRCMLYKSSGPLGKISAPGGRHGNDDAGARTADPSASRWNALRTTRQPVAPGGRHGIDDATMEMMMPDGESLLQNYRTIAEQFVSLRPFAKPDSRNNYGTIRLE